MGTPGTIKIAHANIVYHEVSVNGKKCVKYAITVAVNEDNTIAI